MSCLSRCFDVQHKWNVFLNTLTFYVCGRAYFLRHHLQPTHMFHLSFSFLSKNARVLLDGSMAVHSVRRYLIPSPPFTIHVIVFSHPTLSQTNSCGFVDRRPAAAERQTKENKKLKRNHVVKFSRTNPNTFSYFQWRNLLLSIDQFTNMNEKGDVPIKDILLFPQLFLNHLMVQWYNECHEKTGCYQQKPREFPICNN